jgi:serine/threonine protein kinase
VNGVVYARLEVIGRGGSSKVYKLMAPDGKQYALKKVNLKTADQFATDGYRNEISLLQKLRNNERIIRLIDAEVNDNFILVVMELGEVDLATLMKREQGNLSINFIRMYWEQVRLLAFRRWISSLTRVSLSLKDASSGTCNPRGKHYPHRFETCGETTSVLGLTLMLTSNEFVQNFLLVEGSLKLVGYSCTLP